MIPAVPKGATLIERLPGTQISIYVDECLRQSMCRSCDGPILKGEQRIALSELHAPRMQTGGGKAMIHRFFWHPECWQKLAELPDERLLCWSCRETVDFNSRANSTHVGRGVRASLCTKCIKSSDWNWCVGCFYYAHRHESSEIIEEGVRVGKYVCDRCVDQGGDWLTVKIMKGLKK